MIDYQTARARVGSKCSYRRPMATPLILHALYIEGSKLLNEITIFQDRTDKLLAKWRSIK